MLALRGLLPEGLGGVLGFHYSGAICLRVSAFQQQAYHPKKCFFYTKFSQVPGFISCSQHPPKKSDRKTCNYQPQHPPKKVRKLISDNLGYRQISFGN